MTTTSSEEQTDISETPPVPVEFSSDTTSLNDVILISPPPPPAAYDDQIETTDGDFAVPAPVLNEEVIAALHAKDRMPHNDASVLSEPEPRASVVVEAEADYKEAENELKPTEGNGAAVVAVGGMVAVELKEKVESPNRKGSRESTGKYVAVESRKEKVTVESPNRRGSHESTGKHVAVESAKGKVTVEHPKNVSDATLDKGTSGKRAVSLAYAVANEDKRKSVNVQPKKTEVTSNRKSYAAPAAPTQQSKSITSPTIAPMKVAIVSVAAAASRDDEHQKPKVNDDRSDIPEPSASPSKSTVPPAPPPPPPPSFGTLSRTIAPSVTDGNKSPPVSSNGHKHLDESRKRDQSHAELMAAVLKRKNVVDTTDGDQLAESIDLRTKSANKQQKIVYRADNTKEVKLPPVAAVGLLTPAEGALPISKEDDSPGFRDEAEKMRQAFLLKKTVSREPPGTTQARPGENGMQTAATGEKKPTDGVSALSTNGALPREDARTSDNRTVNRPKSTVVNPPPVLADVAAIIAQKALARQKKSEAEPKVDEAKLKIADVEPKGTDTELKVAEASPKVSSVPEKASIANRSVFESGTLKPAVSATLPKNSTSTANANVGGPILSVTTRSEQPTVTNQQTKVYGASVTSSSTLQTNNYNPDSTLTLRNTKLGNGKPPSSNRNTSVYTSSTITTPMANAPRNRNSSVYPSSPPVAVETPSSMAKSSRQVTTLPTGAKANSAKPSVEAPLVIPPPFEFATPDAGFNTETNVTATLRSKTSQSNTVVFRAKSSSSSDPAGDPGNTAFRNRSIATWNEDDVAEWLKSFDYSDYHPLFAEKRVTGQVLAQMKANELEAMGITNMLHRNRIEREIRSAMARK